MQSLLCHGAARGRSEDLDGFIHSFIDSFLEYTLLNIQLGGWSINYQEKTENQAPAPTLTVSYGEEFSLVSIVI